MAGDWLKICVDTPDKPEIEAMAVSLQIDPDEVFGKCFRVWRWFDAHTQNGNAPSVSKLTVDRKAGVSGFADAMEKVGWLIEDGCGLSLPNFERHNGKTAKNRALTAQRVARHAKTNANTNGPSVSDTLANALPREEKRRDISSPLRFEEGDMELALWMWNKIQQIQPNRKPPNLEKWAVCFRLLRETDGKSPQDIRELFSWVNKDPFWQTNILSPDKLRAKWDDLELKRKAPSARDHPPKSSPERNLTLPPRNSSNAV